MNQLLDQLGINWQLFLSQAVNFFILLLVLRFFVYKPLLAIIKERNKKIQEGLEKAKEADIRLQEVDSIAKGKLHEADAQSVRMMQTAEVKAKQLETALMLKAEQHQKEAMEKIDATMALQKEEAKKMVLSSAAELVKKIIIKTVELSPKEVDEALIQKAVSQMKDAKV